MIHFVDKKSINYKELRVFLKSSEEENHWTNFGPVSSMLEAKLEECFNLDEQKTVLVCSNGTEALFCLVHMHNYLSNRPLRWIVSSFGFYCSHQGPLADAIVVDCNEKAVLDLNLLVPNTFDGIIITNPFGILDNLDEYRDYCVRHNKILICDSGSGFDALKKHEIDEAFSLHHTKPWGFGEGGCIIVDKKNKELIRSIANFGKFGPKEIFYISTNAKISDIACACILQRFNCLQQIKSIGIQQYNRIAKCGEQFGFKSLVDRTIIHVPHCVPLISKKPILNVDNTYVKLHKYYEPLEPTLVATRLYNQIVNFPCHKAMEKLSDKELEAVFLLLTR
jgi:dTDP-4-amino-4,6-dideoxygalactose transaminase